MSQPFVDIVDMSTLMFFYRAKVSLGSDLWGRLSQTDWVSPTPCAALTDVTMADEDTNSILTDNANRTIQGNILQCKWPNLMTNFGTNTNW